MKYLKNKTKKCNLILLMSCLMTFSSSMIAISKTDVSEAKAYIDDKVYMAIDSSKGIGYLSKTFQDFMMFSTYFCEFDITEIRSATIFLQDEYQGSSSYLSDIKTVLIVDEIRIYDCAYLFAGLENLEQIVNIGNLDVSKATSFTRMFENTPKLKTIDFKDFDISECGNLSEMFAGSSFESLDLSGFNTSSCYDFQYMFNGCSEITSLDLSSFNTKNASRMEYMFYGCSSLEYLDISSFDLSKSPYTEGMLRGSKPKIIKAPKVVPEPHAHGDNVLEFYLPQMSEDLVYYYDVDLNNFTQMAQANESITYYDQFTIKRGVESYSQSALALFEDFTDDSYIDLDLLRSKWETISSFDFSQYYGDEDFAAMSTIFEKCKVDTINETVSEFLTLYEHLYTTYCHALTNYGEDFLNRCPNALDPDGLVHIGVNTDENVGYISSFDTYEILQSDLKTKVNLKNVNIQDSIFSLVNSSEYKDITNIVIQDEIAVPTCENLFKGLENVVSIEGMDNLLTDSITNCSSMFEGCSSLFSVDLTSLDTDDVHSADRMFKDCEDLVEIKSLKFDSKSLQSMSEMFSNCQALTLLDLSNFDLTNVANSVDCLSRTSFVYLKTPKAMPTKTTCQFDLYFPISDQNFAYYGLNFETYEKLPYVNSSILIISSIGKYVLDDICDRFIDDCEYYCDINGNTSQEKLFRLWENASEDFENHLIDTPSECLMAFFTQDNSSSVDALLKEFSGKYDYIYGKYHKLLDEHGGDFAQRSNLISFVNNLPSNVFANQNNEATYVMVSIISIFDFGLLLFLISRKKRRLN